MCQMQTFSFEKSFYEGNNCISIGWTVADIGLPYLRMRYLSKKFLSQGYDRIRSYRTQQPGTIRHSGDEIPPRHKPKMFSVLQVY